MDDFELLRQYVRDGSDAAFSRLVQRHIHLVYSSACRQLRDSQAAEDVTQTVFLVLSRRAKHVCDRGGVLSAWLLATTRYVVRDTRKLSRRRRYHERKGGQMAISEKETTAAADEVAAQWEQLSPMLDDALRRLRESFRAAVVLRFFENRSFGEVAECLGITEANARQRVSRGIEQLRGIFARRGVALPACGLEALLLSHSVQAAPAGLSAGAVALTSKGAVLNAGQIAVVKGTWALWMPLAAKAAVVAVALGAVIAATAGAIKLADRSHPTAAARVAAVPPTVVALQAPAGTAPVKGKVLGADGKPLAGADVWLSRKTGRFPVVVLGRQTLPMSMGLHLKSAPDGSFEFPPIDDAVSVVVLSPAGTTIAAVAEVRQNGVVKIAPWAVIEGTVSSKGKPVVDALLELDRANAGEMHLKSRVGFQPATTHSDASGHFIFPNVMAGQANLSVSLKHLAPSDRDRQLFLKADAGEHLKLEIGTGPIVKGRVIPRPGLPTFTGGLDLVRKGPAAPERPYSWISFTADADGNFEAEGVPPGTYTFSIGSWEHDAQGRSYECFALYHTEIDVPAATDARSATVIDLGIIQPNLLTTLQPGQPVPDFPIKMVGDGSPKRLADFKGKYVILHFVDPPSIPQLNDVRAIDALYKRFGGNPRVAILEVARGSSEESVARYRDQNKIPWNLAIGSVAKFNPADRIEGAITPPGLIPVVYFKTSFFLFVIDPAGNLLAKNLDTVAAGELLDRELSARRG